MTRFSFGQVDLLLGYTYFKDHAAEWKLVDRTGDGFKLRRDIYKYNKHMNNKFESRLKMIEEQSAYPLKKLYQILSSHMHGQTTLTIPRTNALNEVVSPDEFIGSIIELQRQTSIAASNLFTAIYAPHWPELPVTVVARVKNALKTSDRPKFFDDSSANS